MCLDVALKPFAYLLPKTYHASARKLRIDSYLLTAYYCSRFQFDYDIFALTERVYRRIVDLNGTATCLHIWDTVSAHARRQGNTSGSLLLSVRGKTLSIIFNTAITKLLLVSDAANTRLCGVV